MGLLSSSTKRVVCVSSKRNKQRSQPSPNNLAAPAHRPLDSILPVGPVAGQVISRTVSQSYSGPVPPPAVLREYDQIVPGAAARILAQAEAQTQHRIKLEDKVTTSDICRSYWGLGIGAIREPRSSLGWVHPRGLRT